MVTLFSPFLVFVFFIVGLARMEGDQGALVGFQVVDPSKYNPIFTLTTTSPKGLSDYPEKGVR